MERPPPINEHYAHALSFARSQNLLAPEESFEDAFARVRRVVLEEIETQWGTDPSILQSLKKEYDEAIANGDITLGTPILINAGRPEKDDQPLTSCIAPPRDVLTQSLRADLVATLYDTEMGMAVNLDDTVGEPRETMEWLDEQARLAEGRGRRRACNMVTMSANHPKIMEFIEAKIEADPTRSKCNISVMVDDRFMRAVENDEDYPLDLRCGEGEVPTTIRAQAVFERILAAAHKNGDPGLIFKDRLMEDDPTPHLSDSIALAPCAELVLVPGEACQFSYINLGNMITEGKIGERQVNWKKLAKIIRFLTRFLDNALEYSIPRYYSEESRTINRAKRKIGVGVLGLADLLIELGIAYDSEEALEVTHEIMAFINHHSKKASVELAHQRGPFTEWRQSRYRTDPAFRHRRLSRHGSALIEEAEWQRLSEDIRDHGLRNAATFASPPTGRSSQLIQYATASIEPLWSCLVPAGDHDESDAEVFDVVMGEGVRKVRINRRLVEMLEAAGVSPKGELTQQILKSRGAIGNIEGIPRKIRVLFKTTGELSPADHIRMVGAVQAHIDEAVAKTVNLPNEATVDTIRGIYLHAWKARLKGITIFRDGCVGETHQMKWVAQTAPANSSSVRCLASR